MPKFDPTRVTNLRVRDLPGGPVEGSELPSGDEVWYGFALSYKDAGDHLASVVAKDPWRNAMLAAPMLFLYRHYIELHLKSLLRDAGELLDEPQAIPGQHYLWSLWNDVRSLLLRISPESDGEWFTRADEIVEDFDDLDKGSFACRYPVDKKGAPSLTPDFAIDAKVVRQMIGELSILLDGASTQIDVCMGYKHEVY